MKMRKSTPLTYKYKTTPFPELGQILQ